MKFIASEHTLRAGLQQQTQLQYIL